MLKDSQLGEGNQLRSKRDEEMGARPPEQSSRLEEKRHNNQSTQGRPGCLMVTRGTVPTAMSAQGPSFGRLRAGQGDALTQAAIVGLRDLI